MINHFLLLGLASLSEWFSTILEDKKGTIGTKWLFNLTFWKLKFSLEPIVTYADIKNNCTELKLAWRIFSLFGSTSLLKELFKHKNECPVDDVELLEKVVKSDNPDACKVVLENFNKINNISTDLK